MAFLSIITILIAIALSITGPYEGLRIQNPEQFQKLSTLFNPVSKVLKTLKF
jgi:hypothetical protein